MSTNKSDYNKIRTNLFEALPGRLQTDINRSVIETTFNRFLSKPEHTRVAGFVGKSRDERSLERKIPEYTPFRNNHQLQPLAYTKIGTEEHISSLEDFLKEADRLGIDTDRLAKWGDSLRFNWTPPVDFDKLVNFRDYYWVDNDNPHSTADYIVIRDTCKVVTNVADRYDKLVSEIGYFQPIVAVDAIAGSFTISGKAVTVFLQGSLFYVKDSVNESINNTFFSVESSSYDIETNQTTIYVNEFIGDDEVSGTISLSEYSNTLRLSAQCVCEGSGSWDGTLFDSNVDAEDFHTFITSISSEIAPPLVNETPNVYRLWFNPTTDELYQSTDTNNDNIADQWVVKYRNFTLVLNLVAGSESWDGDSAECSTRTHYDEAQVPWIKNNKWVHIDDVQNFTTAKQARYPIIEYWNNVEMNGWVKRTHLWMYRATKASYFEETDRQPLTYELSPLSVDWMDMNLVDWYLPVELGDLSDELTEDLVFAVTDTNPVTYENNTGQYTVEEAQYVTTHKGKQTKLTVKEPAVSTVTTHLSGRMLILPITTSLGDLFEGFHEQWCYVGVGNTTPTANKELSPLYSLDGTNVKILPTDKSYADDYNRYLLTYNDSIAEYTIQQDGVEVIGIIHDQHQKVIKGSNDLRIYINGVRQLIGFQELNADDMNLPENSEPNPPNELPSDPYHVYGIRFSEPLSINDVIRLELGAIAAVDMAVDTIQVRTVCDDVEYELLHEQGQQPIPVSLTEHQRYEQLKQSPNQYPLFNLFDVNGNSLDRASPLFMYKESPDRPVVPELGGRRVVIDQFGRDYLFEHDLVEEENGRLFAYRRYDKPIGNNLQTIWAKGNNDERYIPQYRDFDGNVTGLSQEGDWELVEQMYFNTLHENRKDVSLSDITAHLLSVIRSQNLFEWLASQAEKQFHLILNPNYGLGGHIREYNDGFDSFISAIYNRTVTPTGLIDFARRQYDDMLSTVKEILRLDIIDLLVDTESVSRDEHISYLVDNVLEQFREIDQYKVVFGDTTTYDKETNIGMPNWITTIPYIGMQFKQRPSLVVGDSELDSELLHHDGHRSVIAFSSGVLEQIKSNLSTKMDPRNLSEPLCVAHNTPPPTTIALFQSFFGSLRQGKYWLDRSQVGSKPLYRFNAMVTHQIPPCNEGSYWVDTTDLIMRVCQGGSWDPVNGTPGDITEAWEIVNLNEVLGKLFLEVEQRLYDNAPNLNELILKFDDYVIDSDDVDEYSTLMESEFHSYLHEHQITGAFEAHLDYVDNDPYTWNYKLSTIPQLPIMSAYRILSVDPTAGTIEIETKHPAAVRNLTLNNLFEIVNSTSNDGWYTVVNIIENEDTVTVKVKEDLQYVFGSGPDGHAQLRITGGYWKDLYYKVYGTPYPHREPWVLQGFEDKPVWWDEMYLDQTGTRFWTYDHSSQTGMWHNVQYGIVPAGKLLPNGRVSNGYVAEAPTYKFMSVNIDDVAHDGIEPDGLIPPFWDHRTIFTAAYTGPIRTLFSDYSSHIVVPYSDSEFGDRGKVEWEWFTSSFYLYGLLKTIFKLQPVRFMHDLFGFDVVTIDGLKINKHSEKVHSHVDVKFHGDIDDDGNLVVASGLNQWYVNYNRYRGFDMSKADFRDMWIGWRPKFSYLLSSFVDTSSMGLYSDLFKFTDKDYDITIKKSYGIDDLIADSFRVSVLDIPSAFVRYSTDFDWKFEVDTNAPVSRPIEYYNVQRYQCLFDTQASVFRFYTFDVIQTDTVDNRFILDGDVHQHFPVDAEVVIRNSTGNNGTWTVKDVRYQSTLNRTEITVVETITDPTSDGIITGTGNAITWETGQEIHMFTSHSLPKPLLLDQEYFAIMLNDKSGFYPTSTKAEALALNATLIEDAGSGQMYVGNVRRTFNVFDFQEVWYHFELDTNSPLNTVTPPISVQGFQGIIDLIDGYDERLKEKGVHENYESMEQHESYGRPISWQLTIEEFIEWAYNARVARHHTKTDQFPCEIDPVTDSLNFTHAPVFQTGTPVQIVSSGTPPTPLLNKVKYFIVNQAGTIKLATTLSDSASGTTIDFTDQGSGSHYLQEYTDSRTVLPAYSINPFKRNVWFETEKGIIADVNVGSYKDTILEPLVFDEDQQPFENKNVFIYRQDKLTRIRVDESAVHDLTYIPKNMAGAHVFVDGYEHVLILNCYTESGNLIYDPFLGLDFGYVELDFLRNTEFTQRPNVGGHYLIGNELRRNWESGAHDMRYYYDTYQVPEGLQTTKHSRLLLGYEGTEGYLDNMSLNAKSQFAFWKGLIQHKGSMQSIDAFMNTRRLDNAQVDEYWAYRVGEFGDAGEKRYPEMKTFISDAKGSELRIWFANPVNLSCDNGGYGVPPWDDAWAKCDYTLDAKYTDDNGQNLIIVYDEATQSYRIKNDKNNMNIILSTDERRWWNFPDQMEDLKRGMFFEARPTEHLFDSQCFLGYSIEPWDGLNATLSLDRQRLDWSCDSTQDVQVQFISCCAGYGGSAEAEAEQMGGYGSSRDDTTNPDECCDYGSPGGYMEEEVEDEDFGPKAVCEIPQLHGQPWYYTSNGTYYIYDATDGVWKRAYVHRSQIQQLGFGSAGCSEICSRLRNGGVVEYYPKLYNFTSPYMQHNLGSDGVHVTFERNKEAYIYAGQGPDKYVAKVGIGYLEGTNELIVYKNGEILELDVDYFETKATNPNYLSYSVEFFDEIDYREIMFGFKTGTLIEGKHYERINSKTIKMMTSINSALAVHPFILTFDTLKIWGIDADYNVFNTTKLIDKQSRTVVTSMPFWNPAKGQHHAKALEAVTFMGNLDPARYRASYLTSNIDDNFWTDAHEGDVWVDTHAASYMPYFDVKIFPEINTRLEKWGKLAAWADLPVYQWVKSPVHPLEWENYVKSFARDTTVDQNIKPSGKAKTEVFVRRRQNITIQRVDLANNELWANSNELRDGDKILFDVGPNNFQDDLPYPLLFRKFYYVINSRSENNGTQFQVSTAPALPGFVPVPVNIRDAGTVDGGNVYLVPPFRDADWRIERTEVETIDMHEVLYRAAIAGEDPTIQVTKFRKQRISVDADENVTVLENGDYVSVYKNGSLLEGNTEVQHDGTLNLFYIDQLEEQDIVEVVRFRHTVTEAEQMYNPSSNPAYPSLVEYKEDHQFSLGAELDEETGATQTVYYFWVRSSLRNADEGVLSGFEIESYLKRTPEPYSILQRLVKSEKITTPTSDSYILPDRYEQIIFRGLKGYLNDDERYAIRFVRDFTLRDKLEEYDCDMVGKNTLHTEWRLFREKQTYNVDRELWDAITESIVGHKIGSPSTRVPSLYRELYDEKYGTETKYGLRDGQTFVNADYATQTILADLRDPDNDFNPIDINVFLDRYNFNSSDNVIELMDQIYTTFTADDVNRIFFKVLHDAFTTKFEMPDIFKTSWVAIHRILINDEFGGFNG